MIKIEQVKSASTKDLAAINNLLPQLNPAARVLGAQDYKAIVKSPNSFLFVARDKGGVVGMATLAITHIPMGRRGWIEDVVVDANYRGQGIGSRLSDALLKMARKQKVSHLQLTSRPSRQAANRLYRRIGFRRKVTNVYKMKLK